MTSCGPPEDRHEGDPYGSDSSAPESKEAPIDDVPEEVREAARRAFDARLSGVPVADLVYDSLLDESVDLNAEPGEELARSGRAADIDLTEPPAAADALRRRLRFATDRDSIVVTADATPEKVHLSVQLVPPSTAATRIEVRGGHGKVDAPVDAAGRAEVDVPAGLISVLVSRAGDGEDLLQTAWVRL